MKEISRSVTRKDHGEKIAGTARYVGDFSQKGVLHGSFVRSPHAHARIVAINYPKLPKGYFSVDYRDVPGENIAHVVLDDSPVYAAEYVEYIGEAVAMIVGPDARQAANLAAATEVAYEPLPAVLDPDESETVFFDYHFGRGDVDGAFAAADKVYDEHFSTGYQEQAYLEPQGMIAQYRNGVLAVHGSLQCPYYILAALQKATGLPCEQLQVAQDYTGGGFGGKEAYPSILACQVAVAAYKAAVLAVEEDGAAGGASGAAATAVSPAAAAGGDSPAAAGSPAAETPAPPAGDGAAVRVIFGRREDMEFTSKRHPSRCHYRAAVKDGAVTALEAYVQFDSGAFTTLSPVV
ncbi:MAG: molybdopterin-dependent oxidoreductase, partial [Coriobacteriales bacterium]|nr:molybdopterin-dependent oxidoreductase [Coriobacteriales bacterium]